jgi:hypothetical protein
MCDPATLSLIALGAGTALSAGGGIIAGREATRNAKSIADARNRELERILTENKRNTERARSIFDARIEDINENAGSDLETSQQGRVEGVQRNIEEAPMLPIEIGQSAPKVVQSSLSRTLADARADSLGRAESLGKLGGFGDFFQRSAIADETAGRGIDQQLDSIRGRTRLLPSLLDYEEIMATKPQSGLGDILRVIGGGLAQYGGTLAGGAPSTPGSGNMGAYYNDFFGG